MTDPSLPPWQPPPPLGRLHWLLIFVLLPAVNCLGLLWLATLTRSEPATLIGAAGLLAVDAMLLAANLRRRRVLTPGRAAGGIVLVALMTVGWAVVGVIVLLPISRIG
jgi:hypothetical protein